MGVVVVSSEAGTGGWYPDWWSHGWVCVACVLTGFPLLQNWQGVLGGSAALAGISWVFVLWLIPENPVPFRVPVFRWNSVRAVFRDHPVMLDNLEYWGHMRELRWTEGFEKR